MEWVNPKILRQMRERRGLSPEEVAAQSGALASQHYAPIEADELRRWEAGEAEPDLEHLETLSEIYRCPVGYFFLDTLPEAKAVGGVETIQVSGDLVLEVHFEDDRPLLRLISQSMQRDGTGGEVVIYLDEIKALGRALREAEAILEVRGHVLPRW